MISHPAAVVALLLGVESLVLGVASLPRCKKYFSFLPPVFWIYFLPMILSTAGLIDPHSSVYPLISSYILPASLVLLLLSSDIRQIMKLGKSALTMMAAGSFGIMLGTVAAVSVFRRFIDGQAWGGFGALSASWTGGSANMIAVKEALSVPEGVFTPMVIVDTVVPYTWMGILIALAVFQKKFDVWNRSDTGQLTRLRERVEDAPVAGFRLKKHPLTVALVVVVALCGGFLSQWISGLIPEIPNVLSRYAWMIICVSLLGVSLSFTRARALEGAGASDIGYFMLYFVLTSIGAKASLQNIGPALLLVCAGFLIIAVHALVLFSVARLIRAPLFLVATASQANVGGVASAPMVAAVYQPSLASVGLLLAILGNILGTYVGIITGRLCYLIK